MTKTLTQTEIDQIAELSAKRDALFANRKQWTNADALEHAQTCRAICILRYEEAPTLKQRVDGGALVYVENAKGERVASLYREDPQYVFAGSTGRHTLAVACTDDARLQAHWDGFSEACLAAARVLAELAPHRPVCSTGCGE